MQTPKMLELPVNILKKYKNEPIIGLAPMDGVTDAAYRAIQMKYGRPDFVMTEFTNVIGLSRGIERLFEDQLYSETERPIIGQIYGSTPEDFYHAAKIIAALKFDGIDINMGCPAKNVASSGAGAALINTPDLAKKIILETKKGVTDYFKTGELTGRWSDQLIKQVNNANEVREQQFEKLLAAGAVDQSSKELDDDRAANFTVSVKTRIGYKEIVVEDWIKQLTETEPDWIGIHGRTLKQMYLGQADWDSLALGVQATHLPVFINGDIDSSERMVESILHTGARGAMIGRASFGNPWIFSQLDKVKEKIQTIRNNQNGTTTVAEESVREIADYRPELNEVLDVMLQHAHLHWQLKNEQAFLQMRKNLAWYIKGIHNASEFRSQLVRASNPEEVEKVVAEIKTLHI